MSRRFLLPIIALIAVAIGASLFSISTPAAAPAPAPDMAKVRKEMKAAKAALEKQEKYNCCIEPSCDFCAMAQGECPCAKNIAKGKPICGNCADGWAAGKGDAPNVDRSKIQRFSEAQAKTMFEKYVANNGK
jgi:hypothetical protein